MSLKLIKVMEDRKTDILVKVDKFKRDVNEWREEQQLVDNLRKAEDSKLTEDENESLEYESMALGDLIKWREYHLSEQQQELRLVEAKIKYLKQIT